MRPAVVLAIVASLTAATFGRAAPLRPPPALPGPPAEEAPSDQGTAVLQSPGPDAILIRGGTFMMGSNELGTAHALATCRFEPARDDCTGEMFAPEYAPHEVLLGDYWIDRTEVTVARYRQCVAAGRCAAPPYASGGERFDRPD